MTPQQAKTPDSKPAVNSDTVAVGRVLKSHGVHGELKVLPLSNVSGRFDTLTTVIVERTDGSSFRTTVDSVRGTTGNSILALHGINSRDDADALRGAFISVDRENMPPLSDNEFYTIDLVGMQVVDEAGAEMGTVDRVEEYPSSAILIVSAESETIEIPLVHDFVLNVDTETDTITASKPDVISDDRNRGDR